MSANLLKTFAEIDLEGAKAIKGGQGSCSCNCNCLCDCGPYNAGANANNASQNYMQQTLYSFRG